MKRKTESNIENTPEPKKVKNIDADAINDFVDLNEAFSDVMTDEKPLQIHTLILAPSRELAAQIKSHLDKICVQLGINVMSLTGGANHYRQKSRIEKNPEIVVGTPGRVFDYANIVILIYSLSSK